MKHISRAKEKKNLYWISATFDPRRHIFICLPKVSPAQWTVMTAPAVMAVQENHRVSDKYQPKEKELGKSGRLLRA